jgi:hypothetical protein
MLLKSLNKKYIVELSPGRTQYKFITVWQLLEFLNDNFWKKIIFEPPITNKNDENIF